jgi:hypothetical protein
VFRVPVVLNGERPLEELGKIVLLSPTSQNIILEGSAIHQSAILENNKE